MCGRFCLDVDPGIIAQQFALSHTPLLTPRYNIAPAQPVPVIREPGKLDFLTWGLRPVWIKQDQQSFINARIETIHEKPAFRNAFKKRRCLVLANGYYEWKQIGKLKQPFYITLPGGELFAFAAVWENDTCAILTKPADIGLHTIHARMPVILTPQNAAAWLNLKSSELDINNLLVNSISAVKFYPVSTKVNNPQHDFIECISALQ